MNLIIKGRLSKWIIVVVAVGMFAQPVQQVLAAESREAVGQIEPGIEQTARAEKIDETINSTEKSEAGVSSEEALGDVATDEETAKDEKEDEAVSEDKEQPEEEEETTGNGIPEPPAVPNVQLPPSTIKQKVADADVASGALVYNYALQVPQGRGGMQPSLSLSYNSQQNEEGSLVGYGWGLDIPTIERKNVDGLNKMYTSENFTSSMSGDLKKISTSGGVSEFGAKIDTGNFLNYSFDADASAGGGVWTVKDKTGTTFTYGADEQSRLSNPTDVTKVFRWYLTRITDAKGNFVSYEYSKIDGQVYPSVIRYTNFRSGVNEEQGIFKIQFNLEDRPDKAMSAKYGFMVTNTKRIASVEMVIGEVVVGRYDLNYAQQSVNHRSQLAGIEYIGFDSSGANPITDGGMSFAYESIAATDLLTKITQNTGGTTTITYKSSAQYRDSEGESLNPNMPFAVQTVEKIEYDDRNGQVWQNTFGYAGGWYYYNGPMDRRFVGFEKVVRTDDVGNTVATFYHQGNEANVAYGELLDDWAKAGKVYKSELRDSAGNLFTQALNKWEFDRLPGVGGAEDRSFAKLSAVVSRTFDGDTSHKDKASTYVYDEDTGNLLSGIDFGLVTANDVGTFTDVGTDKLTTTVSYAEPIGDETIIGLPSGYIERNQANVKVKEGKNYYDGLAFGEVDLGNGTKDESWISGSSYASVTRTFNDYGMPVTETDPVGNVTSYEYDEFNLYPETVTNALSQEVNYEYDYRVGQPFKTTDANGLVNKITYDGLGRAIKEELTQPGQTDPNVLFTKKSATYELYEQSVPGGSEVRGWKTSETNYLDEVNATSPRERKTITYTDGFDRPVQTRALVESADNAPSTPRYTVTDTEYNGLAQVQKTSLPYFSDGDARTAISTNSNLFTSLTYDPAYRVTEMSNVLGTSTNEYNDWKVTSTDASGKVKRLEKDAWDRLVQVEEHNNLEVYVTEYEYDAEGNLAKITDALDNVREFSYDGLGRRLVAEDLHASDDETFGVWEYAYDAAGNLVERTDANSQVVTYEYDALNRVLSEDLGNDNVLEVTFVYDTCLEGAGRLCSSVNSSLETEYEYNVLGQISKETKTIGSEVFVTEHSYDRQGQEILQTNPDFSQVKYEYNIGGVIESVKSKEATAGSFGNVVNDIDYAVTGNVAYVSYANGTETTNTYDSAQMYRLVNKRTASITGGRNMYLQDLSYTYDAVGNILTIIDGNHYGTARGAMYSYDDLHRLVSSNVLYVTGSGPIVQTYEYDAIGNITHKSDVGDYLYQGNLNDSYANPHAVTQIRSDADPINYEYDQNGNVLSAAGHRYEWDYNNRIVTITLPEGARPIEYGYDTSGMRVSVANDFTTTLYPNKGFNTDGQTVQKHIFAGDGLTATIKGTGSGASMSVAHTDHLGSTVAVTNAGGDVEELLDYHPFGEISYNSTTASTPEQRKYIGQEYDTDTELSYLEARYYDGHVGRFLSEDSVHLSIGDPNAIKNIVDLDQVLILSDPQSLNSYSYARNNPLRLKDPGGNSWFSEKYEEAKEKVNQAQVWVGDKANAYAENHATFDYVTSHKWPAYVAGGIGLAAGGAAIGLAVGGAATTAGLTTTAGATGLGVASQIAQKGVDYAVRFGNSYGPQMNEIARDLTDTNPNKFDVHAILRMVQRSVDVGAVNRIMNTTTPFSYLHDGITKTGYYESATKIFIGQVQSSGIVKTIITNVSPSYVENLKNTIK